MALPPVGQSVNQASSSEESCFSGVRSCFKSVQLKFEKGGSTDVKIYGVIVLGVLLQVAAAAAIAAVVFASVAAGPIALVGLVPAVALGVLGVYMASRPEDVEDVVIPPPVEQGQPVGLVNSGQNCWANAAMQLLLNSPGLSQLPGPQSVPEVRQFAQAYETARGNGDRVLQGVDGQLVRDVLARERRIEADPRFQQDPADFFNYVFHPPHSLYQLAELHRLPGEEPVHVPRWESMISLGIGGQRRPPDFNTLFFNQFNRQEDSPIGPQQVEVKFPTPPNDLLIQLERSYYERDPATGQAIFRKNNAPVAVPAVMPLPSRYSQNGEEAQYQCDGFILHAGNSVNEGHYIAYVKRPDQSWWRCDDKRIRRVSEQQAQRVMPYGCIYHFSKNPPEQA